MSLVGKAQSLMTQGFLWLKQFPRDSGLDTTVLGHVAHVWRESLFQAIESGDNKGVVNPDVLSTVPNISCYLNPVWFVGPFALSEITFSGQSKWANISCTHYVEAKSFAEVEDKAPDASDDLQHHFRFPFPRMQADHWHE
eukprot:12403082-Karenia_brevis.AAC.1